MATDELLVKSRTLRHVIEKSKQNFLYEIAAINLNQLLDETYRHLGTKISHINKLQTAISTDMNSDEITKPVMLKKIDKLIELLESTR